MRILVLVVLAAMTGCAAQPESSDTSSKAAPAPAVVLAASSGTTAKAENADAAPAAEFKPPKGYRKRVEGGTTYYCTKVVVLGSRFEKDDCRTQTELEDLALHRESVRGGFEQQRSVCASAAACGMQ